LQRCAAQSQQQPDPAAPEERRKLQDQLDAEIARLDEQIQQKPDNVELYSQRGDQRFFRGRFDLAVADYDQMVKLDPALETSHWRRGIACFYAGKFREAARQFEVYHAFDDVDRENGIWRYLSQVKAEGKEKAREGLLRYRKDDREPFPDLYKMFSGELKPDAVLEKIDKARLPSLEREKRLFYAHLYLGLNDYVEERPESAERHLQRAVRNRWAPRAGGGPAFMWHVARVHHELLEASRNRAAAPSHCWRAGAALVPPDALGQPLNWPRPRAAPELRFALGSSSAWAQVRTTRPKTHFC
jgi:lipoprotein NlpI